MQMINRLLTVVASIFLAASVTDYSVATNNRRAVEVRNPPDHRDVVDAPPRPHRAQSEIPKN